MSDALRFIKKNGRVIPIGAAHAAVAVGAARRVASTGSAITTSTALRKHPQAKMDVKPNAGMKFASTALAIAGGIGAGLSLGHGGKLIAGAHVANEAADIASTALVAGAYAGKGNAKARLKQGADLEIKNQALGWAAYGATALRSSESRAAIKGIAKGTAAYAGKVIALARKALRVVEA